ncbi:LLM class F420-dependent oxidoreductase [Nocardioides humilatus]|uniref:LLM class F420-dependent oxidoreductase n=1 Tax=Nocardioides humilatus TaxID=2607660 RepID=A0A5B1LBL4_9ACTN|nr:LLM class F420-dependent oxidoreductase [Nocardioides humilatus]
MGITLPHGNAFHETVALLPQLERAGVSVVLAGEAYTFDAISHLAYVAARTERVELLAGILPIYTRTPALTAMSSAGLDFVSNGRFHLGLGSSGPQVVEGFHGVPYDAPLGRTREVVDICRSVWRREALVHDGIHYPVPLPADRGTGLGKPLKLIDHPVRNRIPVSIAAIGLRNVELAAEIADGWLPLFFHPGMADGVWGDSLRAGMTRRDPELGSLQTTVQVLFELGEATPERLQPAKEQLALYIGGMGARGTNFYNELACRYGFRREADQIQDRFLAGRKAEAAAAVPDELALAVNLIGTEADLAIRVKEYEAAGVSTVVLTPLNPDRGEQVAQIRRLLAVTG